MGYACPVCEEPQVDAEHLANHLAFTAILRGGDHEAWLDEHVPTWDEQDPETLGAAVAEDAESVEIERSDDDSHPSQDRSEGQADPHTRPTGRTAEGQGNRLSTEDRAVLEEARELTRRMLEDAEQREQGAQAVEENASVDRESTDTEPSDSEKE